MRIDRTTARDAVESFLRLDIPIVGGDLNSIASLNRDAYSTAERLECSFYDAIFIALAERLDSQVLTAERRLYERLRDKSPHLLWIADFEIP